MGQLRIEPQWVALAALEVTATFDPLFTSRINIAHCHLNRLHFWKPHRFEQVQVLDDFVALERNNWVMTGSKMVNGFMFGIDPTVLC